MLDFGQELNVLKELRNSGFANMHAFISEISGVLDKAESSGKIQMPTMTLNLISRSGVNQGTAAQAPTQASELTRAVSEQQTVVAKARVTQTEGDTVPSMQAASSPSQPLTPEQRQAQLANTLSVLGIDLSLLNTNPVTSSDKP